MCGTHTAAAVIWEYHPVFAAVLAIRQRPVCPRHFQNSFAYLGADSGQSPLIHSQVSLDGIASCAVSSRPPSFEALLYCR